MTVQKYIKTAQLSLRGQTNGGIWYLFPRVLVKLIYLIPLLFLWRVLGNSGIDVGMNLPQMLTYTYISALFADQLTVRTVASAWNYEGKLITFYSKPASVFGQITAQTMGEWIPMLLLFSLPMIVIGPMLGITMQPASPWFFISFILCVSLGFAMDFIFVCVTIRMRGMAWLAIVIRAALVTLLSGTLIPFKILPFGLERIFAFQPFGSLGGAPLSLFVGSADPVQVVGTQIVWNIILWPMAILWFRRSQERMVSFGG